MEQYKSGNFGKIKELEKIFSNIHPDTEKIHIGTKEELTKLKKTSKQIGQINIKIDSLNRKLNRLLIYFKIDDKKGILEI